MPLLLFLQELRLGDWASIAGLVVSLGVLVVSGGAKRAALAAARGVRQALSTRTVVGDLRGFSEDLNIISSLSESNRFDVARMLAYRLLQKLSFFAARWHDQLTDDESKDAMQKMTADCGVLTIELRKAQVTSAQGSEPAALKEALERFGALLANEMGRQEARADHSGAFLP